MGRALECVRAYSFTPVHISGDEFLAYGITDSEDNAKRLITIVNGELDRRNLENAWICPITASIGVYAAIPEKAAARLA